MRHAVIGDVGGHAHDLWAEVERLGGDPRSGRLPDDLVVVQVGDLVHRGPHSEEVVAVVDRFLQRSPDRWLQLVGNHEAQYLREPAFEWRQWVNARARATLRASSVCISFGAAATSTSGRSNRPRWNLTRSTRRTASSRAFTGTRPALTSSARCLW